MIEPGDQPRDETENHCYLPNLCTQHNVLLVVLMAQTVAMVYTLARYGGSGGFWLELANTSLFLMWAALAGAASLCFVRPFLARASLSTVTLVSFVIIMAIMLVITEMAWAVSRYAADLDLMGQVLPNEHGELLVRNLGIGAIVAALILRYFYVNFQWQRNVEMEARARVHALQARIRPHFLFNSMNTIASLTRSDPERAEEAIEDLSDLFRVSLGDPRQRIPLKEELEVSRIYQRIEQLRLGERLRVRWLVNDLPMRALVPGLLIQPLLENAIYHGIEPLPEGGEVLIEGFRRKSQMEIRISNPLSEDNPQSSYSGNQLALANVRQRLELAYPGKARVDVEQTPGKYRISLFLPVVENEE
ncbi:MAG: histidine kinase [Gammaproteobacteria bacterium]|nr:histidine kinase [Gammaproteobacteria bacterium]MCZ6687356.1 histidine kinase [Gammaproteobacteria bacterium]MCZ6761406.1 histidine kinase [Gammaproteobacteria bacterium]